MTDEVVIGLRLCLARSHGMLCDRQAGHSGDHVDIFGPLPGHTWSSEAAAVPGTGDDPPGTFKLRRRSPEDQARYFSTKLIEVMTERDELRRQLHAVTEELGAPIDYRRFWAEQVQEGLFHVDDEGVSRQMTQTVAVDFDGVIHAYSKGWHDGTIYDEPLPGAIEGLRRLQERYAVFVFTSREIEQVIPWLEAQGLDVIADSPPYPVFWSRQDQLLVTNRKLPAVAYIDDRAVRFLDWDTVPDQLDSL